MATLSHVTSPEEGDLLTGHALSPMQEGMLFHHLAAPGSGVDIEQILCRLQEPLDTEAFASAFDYVIAQRPVLRTCFAWEGRPRPIQIVTRPAPQSVAHLDLTGLSATQQQHRLEAFLREDRNTGFDLKVAPLSRLAFIRHSQAENTIVWTFHHILLDGRSFPLVLSDVFAAYDALLADREPILPKRPDFSTFLELTPATSEEDSAAYYRTLLQGYSSPLALDVGFCARTAWHSPEDSVETRLGEPLSAALAERAAAFEVTPNTLCQLAWALLLQRYSGSEDVLFGVTRTCRDPAILDVADMVGLLINTVPMRLHVGRAQPLLQALQAARQQHLALRDHERLALTKIQTESALPGGTPLFETIVVVAKRSLDQQMREQDPRFAHAVFSYHGKTNFPLTLAVYLDPAILIRLEFDPVRYDVDTARRLLGHFVHLLTAMASAAPETPLSALPMLDEAERKRLLFDWNQTDGPFPEHLRLHDGFVAQARRTPLAVAAVCDGVALSYGELDRAANRVANLLQARGVGAGEIVAVCMPRSLSLLSALLGVLKAGGAYVPIDPEHPRQRQTFMVEDAGARLLLATADTAAICPSALCETLCVDDDALLGEQSDAEPHCSSYSDDLAYVIYTSGSTGTPKGVAVRHQPAVNLIDWVNDTFAVGPRDRLLFVTSVCFDLSVYDIFGVLSAGGSLHVATENLLRDPRELCRLLTQGGITFWDSAPAALTQLAPFFPTDTSDGALRLVFLSGDWIPVPLPDRIRTAFRGAEVVALGGATEATVWSNYYRIGRVDPHWPSIPYGRPIRNARYYVLDETLSPQPIGVAGELYIGGSCLADGYHHRPQLTAERFVKSPFDEDPKARLYKTGDLARFMPDGHIEFLGRLDQQVKVRGFRVELGEIEAVINQHPGVATCVLDAPRDAGSERILVAYLVAADPERTLDFSAVRALCQSRLPNYMVPGHFVQLTALPLTANGKLDRRALPGPKAEASAAFVAPQTEVERAVAGIFARCLGCVRVGLQDDFFELGGHSLLAVRIIGAIQAELGRELSVTQLLQERTVAALCKHLQDSTTPARATRPPITRADAPPTASFAQQGMAFIQQLAPESAAYNIGLGFDITGPVNAALLAQALAEVVERHEPLRTSFSYEAGELRPIIHPAEAATAKLATVDLSAQPQETHASELARLLTEAANTPFDLNQAPLLRALLVTTTPQAHTLCIVVHHIVFDGASTELLQRDLLLAYDALTSGNAVCWSPLPVRFNDVAVAQRHRAQTDGFAADRAYYRSELSGTLPILQLPHDRPRPSALSYKGAVYPLALGQEQLSAVRGLARSQEVTAFMVLFAAYAALLRRFTEQDDLIVGLPVSDRAVPEVQDLIGLFIDTVAVRIRFDPGDRFDALLNQIKTKTMAALEHSALPFERLVEELNPPRDPSLTPIYQCLFSYQEASGRAYQGAHFSMAPRPIAQTHARTDLSLYLEDSAEFGIRGYFEYSTDLFDEGTIERIAHGLVALIEHVAGQVDVPIDELKILSPTARAEQLFRWNGPAVDFDQRQTVVHRFEDVARLAPERLALLCGGERRTYGQLAAEVVRLANRLIEQGIGPGLGVAILLERRCELVTAILAVLKAGAYYIPLEPLHPLERNQRVLETASPTLIISDRKCAQRVPNDLSASVLRVDDPPSTPPDDRDPGIETSAGQLAYIIFTSGSTGQPKGVEITHRSLTNFLCSMAITPGVHESDRLVAVTTVSFDIAVLELLLPLTVGASVDIVPRDETLSPRALAAHLADGATLFQATPASYRLLLEDGWRGQKGLVALCGGEAMPPEMAAALLPKVDALWNMYGPTETTVWSTLERIVSPSNRIAIGRPIHNTKAYVLNAAREPVPAGVVGQLYIGGAGLARGYHRNPKLTSAAFVADRFSDDPSARMYNTGDLARRLPDGRLLCLGRTDFQVKLRGFRIELGEVENALMRHPNVVQAVAHLQQAGTGPQLVGYVVTDPPSDGIPADLPDLLRTLLPQYMIPSAFVALREFPLTANGKIDRKALPVPDHRRSGDGSTAVGPRDKREQRIADLFETLLGAPVADIHESFFDLGGHSLLAAQLARALSHDLGIEVSLGALFENPTVARLAELAQEGGRHMGSAVLPFRKGGDLPPLYFICGIHLYQELALRMSERQPCYGIFLPVEEEILEGNLHKTPTVQELARLYAAAVLKHCPDGPLSLAGLSFGGVLAYEMARQLRAAERQVLLLAMVAPVMPSSLSRNHLGWLRGRLARLRTAEPAASLRYVANRITPYLERLSHPLSRADDTLPLAGSSDLSDFRGRVYRAAATAYDRAEHRYDGRAIVIRAAGERFEHFEVAPDLGWGRRIEHLRAFQAPGDHLGVLQDPATASILRHELALAYAEWNAEGHSHHIPSEPPITRCSIAPRPNSRNLEVRVPATSDLV